MGVSVEEELVRYLLREEAEDSLRLKGQLAPHVLSDVSFDRLGEELIDLRYQSSHLRDEFDEAFREEEDPIVLA